MEGRPSSGGHGRPGSGSRPNSGGQIRPNSGGRPRSGDRPTSGNLQDDEQLKHVKGEKEYLLKTLKSLSGPYYIPPPPPPPKIFFHMGGLLKNECNMC